MSALPGFVFEDPLVEDESSMLLRGVRSVDGTPVLVRLLRSEHTTPRAVALMRREFDLLKTFDGDSAFASRELVTEGGRLALVYEHFSGEPLQGLMAHGLLDLDEALGIAIQACTALQQVHDREIIHKNISPASLFMDAVSGKARLGDFRYCTELSKERPHPGSAAEIDGRLAYISPEQTGRMNRSVDLRSDLYSLGVTLYEMLTGSLPFESADPLELVHCHIARRPTPPRELDERVPTAVSEVVMKLLAKRAEDRYQSASGLRADLETARRSLRTGTDLSFELGSADRDTRLEIPEILYGRKAQVQALTEAFERVCNGPAELFLVAGYSGVGKSALVHELHKPVVRQRGIFLFGKFDQFRRDVPYRALIHALAQAVQQILAGKEEEVAAWRVRLSDVLGEHGRLLTDLIPGLEVVVGPQAPVQDLPPSEAQSRFNQLLHRFVRAFASTRKPLVLFLDDLQWADSATLALILQLVGDPECHDLLLIGAYRDNEVDDHHPLALSLAQIRRAGGSVHELTLQPLKTEDVCDLVGDALREPRDRVRGLCEVLQSKTDGNPFFLNQFLRSLHERGLLTRGAESHWEWDLARLQSEEITTNVVDLMIQKIRELPEDTQHALRFAACVGSRFDLATLATIRQSNSEATAAALWEAVRVGLALPLGSAYKLLRRRVRGGSEGDFVGAEYAQEVEYRFLHDRVQQAAYALIPNEERQAVHLGIGRLLRGDRGEEIAEERLFDVADHFNRAIELITEADERLDLAHLDLAAGRRALASSAYDAAANYLDAGIELLPQNAWHRHYELALGLFDAAAEAEYMRNRPDAGRERGDVLLRNARQPLEKVKVYVLRIQHANTQARFPDAIDAALEALEQFGVRLPRQPGKARVLPTFFATWARLSRRSMEDLRRLPEMEDAEAMAALGLLVLSSPAAYQSSPELLVLIICKEIDLILRHGLSSHAPIAFSSWAVLICALLDDVKNTYAYGRLSVDLGEQYPRRDVQARANFYFGAFCQHWGEPQRDSDALLTAHQSGALEGGDLQFFGYLVYMPIFLNFFAGGDLEPLIERFRSARRAYARIGLDNHSIIINIGEQCVEILVNGSKEPSRLVGPLFDADRELPRLEKLQHRTACFFVRMNAAVLAYTFGRYDRAFEEAREADALLDAVMATVYVAEMRMLQALSAAALARGRGRPGVRAARGPVLRGLRKLRKWSRTQPDNFRHKADLVEAEWLSLNGRTERAESLYSRAVSGARAGGFTQEAALASERAGIHHKALGRTSEAAASLREAVAGYAAWGARAKAEALRREHAALLVEVTAGTSSGDGIDFQSVLKASQVISGEIVLERLLAKVLRIAVQTAGAERGVLLVIRDGEPLVVADGSGDHVALVDGEPIAEGNRASPSIIHYSVRTREPVVLENAAAEATFASDAYVASRKPRSVLAVPILGQGEVKSVLYLENNLANGAFTPDRVEVLRSLAGQAAISMDNARLYTDMSALNQAYERFVPQAFLRFLDKRSIVDVSLGDHVEREVSVLFADIRSFTMISEGMTPDQNFRFLNSFLERMEPVVEKHGGFIDKYLGDAIMALFAGGAEGPLRAAAEMTTELAALNAERAAHGEPAIEIGIGINTGMAMLGTIGGHRRMDGTVIGDTVNVAERFEKLTKLYQAPVLVSGRTVDALGENASFSTRWLGRDAVRGRRGSVEIHELLDGQPPAVVQRRLASRAALTRALRALDTGDRPGALVALEALLARDPDDRTLAAILARVRAGRASALP